MHRSTAMSGVTGEYRKEERKPLGYRARIDAGDGSEAKLCTLMDVSEGGARLECRDPASIPERFKLLLSLTGAAARRCVVRWRRGGQIGVKFER